jgi:glutamine synthetase
MSAIEGKLALPDLAALVRDGEIDTVLVVFTDLYGRFVGKRLDAEFFLEKVAGDGTHACDYLLTVDMEMEPVQGYEFANWELGYGDVHLVPDLRTLRRASWLENSALVICDVTKDATQELVPEAPRSVLRRQIDRLVRSGYHAETASELEFYVLETTYREAAEQGYHELPRAGWYLEDYHMLHGSRHEILLGPARRHLRASGVPVESSKGEWGLGQHELNIRHAEVLEMSDRHVVFKQCLKELADQTGLSITFMAKYDAASAGSSCHVHLSLWQDGKNAFAGDESLGEKPSGSLHASPLFRWFLAGWIAHTPELMVFYAPTVNSYKRYRAGSWAPTRLAWSHDNRTAAFRVVGEGSSLRIECRIPGADANPYLVYAAALASGMEGIERRLEPPPIFEGDMYAAKELPEVPLDLREATARFEASEFARRAFGENVVKHYAHFFRTEQRAYDSAVTDWERKRYFERI